MSSFSLATTTVSTTTTTTTTTTAPSFSSSSSSSPADAKAFLESRPRGAYTTARTVQGTRIFELQAHIERLATTANLMWGGGGEGEGEAVLPPVLVNPTLLCPLVVQTLRAAMDHYRQSHAADANPPDAAELKLTILLIWRPSDQIIDCVCHAGPLPPRPSPPIKVEIRGAPRTNAKAKDSEWVRDRKPLEALKPPDVNEIVLHDADGALLEGTQTNFYAVMDGKLHTAGEGILEGTVRRLLLEVCAANEIEVVLDPPPNLRDLSKWDGALLSSTSRLALPIDWIGVPGREGEAFDADAGDVQRSFDYGDEQCLTRRLVRLVDEKILEASEDLYEIMKNG